MRISHEAIYQSLFIEGRGALKRELVTCLRTGRALRRPRARSRNKPGGHVTADVVLSERPAEAEDRAVPGHWEGDLILGSVASASSIGTTTLVATCRRPVNRSGRSSQAMVQGSCRGAASHPTTVRSTLCENRSMAAAVRAVLSDMGEATPEQVARQFKRARATSVKPLLESLSALGQARLVEGGRFAA